MPGFDWDSDGKVDSTDDFLDYMIFQEVMKDSEGTSYTSSSSHTEGKRKKEKWTGIDDLNADRWRKEIAFENLHAKDEDFLKNRQQAYEEAVNKFIDKESMEKLKSLYHEYEIKEGITYYAYNKKYRKISSDIEAMNYKMIRLERTAKFKKYSALTTVFLIAFILIFPLSVLIQKYIVQNFGSDGVLEVHVFWIIIALGYIYFYINTANMSKTDGVLVVKERYEPMYEILSEKIHY